MGVRGAYMRQQFFHNSPDLYKDQCEIEENSMYHLSRRALLVAASAVLNAISAASPKASPSANAILFSSIVVDVDALHGNKSAPLYLQAVMMTDLQREFAGRLAKSGPTLVVRLTRLSLSTVVEGAGESGTDYLEGETLLVGPRGETMARYPQALAIPATGLSSKQPDSEQKRLDLMSRTFVLWLRRIIG